RLSGATCADRPTLTGGALLRRELEYPPMDRIAERGLIVVGRVHPELDHDGVRELLRREPGQLPLRDAGRLRVKAGFGRTRLRAVRHGSRVGGDEAAGLLAILERSQQEAGRYKVSILEANAQTILGPRLDLLGKTGDRQRGRRVSGW